MLHSEKALQLAKPMCYVSNPLRLSFTPEVNAECGVIRGQYAVTGLSFHLSQSSVIIRIFFANVLMVLNYDSVCIFIFMINNLFYDELMISFKQ